MAEAPLYFSGSDNLNEQLLAQVTFPEEYRTLSALIEISRNVCRTNELIEKAMKEYESYRDAEAGFGKEILARLESLQDTAASIAKPNARME